MTDYFYLVQVCLLMCICCTKLLFMTLYTGFLRLDKNGKNDVNLENPISVTKNNIKRCVYVCVCVRVLE